MTLHELPFLSLIAPCRNELNYLDAFFASIRAQDYKGMYEVIIADGRSDDGTREWLDRRAEIEERLLILDNERRIVPTGLNLALKRAKGSLVVRLDIHAEYPTNYLTALVEGMALHGADNIGVVCETVPKDDTAQARAIAYMLSHPFGVGNSSFRIGVREAARVDTVPFGCFKREVFSRIGDFDEDLVRNQDEEFNARMVKSGLAIVLLPEPKVSYEARGDIASLIRMLFQYGQFKPLVNLKIGRIISLRQLAPMTLVAGVILPSFLAVAYPLALIVPVLALGMHLAVGASVSLFALSRAKVDAKTAALLPFFFLIGHFAYGIGYIIGFIEFVVLRRRRKDASLTR